MTKITITIEKFKFLMDWAFTNGKNDVWERSFKKELEKIIEKL